MSTALLEARDLHKSFGRRAVLRGVDLEVGPGEIVAIAGENGAGKSTLLRTLVGLLRPDRGHVTITGRLGYCPQEALLFERLTVRENLGYFAAAYGRVGWEEPAQELMAALRFSHFADTLVGELSGGTRQKLNLALALLHDPALLLLDEPYAAFDWETYLRFREHAQAWRAAGRGILVVAHLVFDRSALDRVLTLSEGRLRCA